MNTTSNAAVTHSAAFFSLIRNSFRFRLFLLQNLPAAYFSGLQLNVASEEHCAVSIPFKWFTKNPFRSTYFACLGMAAEMSTGVLVMANVYRRSPKISTLVVAVDGKFYKKATGVTSFVCEDGLIIQQAIQKAIDLSESQTIKAKSSGFNADNELMAEFWITWSFKVKK